MKKEVVTIPTTQPLSEIWSRIHYFRGTHKGEQILQERISNDFYGLDYKTLFKTKKSRALLKLEESSIIISSDIRRKAHELSYEAMQAKEFYDAASRSTEPIKPVLLHYGMISLGKMLVDSTFKFRRPSEKHGLQRKTLKKISIKKRGFFARFHDCYNSNPTIYMDQLIFKMEELFSMIPDLRREYQEVYGKKSRIDQTVDEEIKMSEPFIFERDGLELVFPALTSHFLLMFLFSSLARYKPKEWSNRISGKYSSDIILIRKFLEVSERRFPNLIINELFNKTFIFHPGARLM